MTIADIIRLAMMTIGVLAEGEAPSAAQMADAISLMNMLFDAWSTEKLFVYSVTQDVFSFVGSQQTYQWGIGAPDFTTARPVYIQSASVRISPGNPQQIDIPLEIYNTDQWARLSVKNTSGVWPTRLYVDFQFPYAKLNFWPIPQGVNQVYINSWKPLAAVTGPTESFSLPPGYSDAVMYNLAVRLGMMYGKPLVPELAAYASSSKAKLKISLNKVLLMRADDGLLPPDKVFNYLTGE